MTKAAAEATEGLTSIPRAAALLRSLPYALWAVVTSADRALAERWLRLTRLPVPDVLVAAEDVTAGKPDPEGYIQAAARLGFSPVETVVFEDAPAGLAAGRAAGAHVIALATTLTEAELERHDWLRDFSHVSFSVEPGGCPMLRIGTGLQAQRPQSYGKWSANNGSNPSNPASPRPTIRAVPNRRQPRRVKGSTKLTSTAGFAARLRRVPGERISEGDRRRVHDGKSALGGQVRRSVRVHRGDGAEPLLARTCIMSAVIAAPLWTALSRPGVSPQGR